MSRLAIIAALPREVAPLVRGVRSEPALLKRGIHLYRLSNAVVVAGGMGAGRAALAVEAALATGGITGLVSVGLAGSCGVAVRPGDVLAASVAIDARTGERFAVEHGACVLVTTDSIASVHEKARLASSYGAAMVDMEAAAVARLAVAHGLTFQAIKGISDAHDFELASLSRFAGAHGKFRTGRFALHTALRPHRWRKTMRLGRASSVAIAALNGRLAAMLTDEAISLKA